MSGNQTPPLCEYNLFTTDQALKEAVAREGAAAHAAQLGRDGAAIGTTASFEHGRLANRHPPVLQTFNVRGEPIVCSPEDAYRCFVHTEMDYLVVGNFLLDRTEQPARPADRRVAPQVD